MRVTVIDKANLQQLSKLLGDKIGLGSALDQLKHLNPHVDFKKIEPGTVLFIPEGPGFHDVEGVSVTADAFRVLREQMLASIDDAASRLRIGYEALLTEQKEVVEVLKSPSVAEAIKTDPHLNRQIAAANEVFKQDSQLAKNAEEVMRTLKTQVGAELASLTQQLG